MEDRLPAALMAAPFDAEAELEYSDTGELPAEGPAARWAITDLSGAEWAMRMLAALEAEAHAVRAQADLWREPIEDWERAEVGRVARKADFFRGHLERYAKDQRAETGRATLKLPSGDVATRESAARAEVTDPVALLAWAEAQPEELRNAVAPRKVSLTGVQALVEVRQVAVRADVFMLCGCIWTWERTAPEDELPYPLGVWDRCPECGTVPAQVGTVLPELEYLALYDGKPVPGVAARDPHLNVTAKPNPRRTP